MNIRRLSMLFVCPFLFLMSFPLYAQKQVITIAYLENGLMDMRNTERQVALQILATELQKNVEVDVIISAMPGIAEIEELIKSKKVSYVIINSYYYLKHKDIFTPSMTDTFWAIQRAEKPEEDYFILVNNKIKYKNENSLQDYRLSIHQDYLLMNFYLESFIYNAKKLPLKKFFKEIKNTKTASQAVLDVFFNVSDVCIIPKHMFDMVVELNPAINHGLKIVHQSGEHFIPAVVLSFSGETETGKARVDNNIDNLANTVRGQQILDLFKIKALPRASKKQFDYMFQLYKDYKNNGGA